ncbi:Transposon Ty3-I Gag-Pol polyprotein, partial [Smittium culicis]
MNNMKPTYLKILTKPNPKTYLEAISLLIQKGDVINMNAAMTGSKHSDDSIDVDAFEIDDYYSTIEVNLVSIDQRGKTFWVTVKESKAPDVLELWQQDASNKRLHRNEKSLEKEAKIRSHTAGKSFTPGVRVLDTPGIKKFNQEFIGAEVDGGPSIPIMEKKFSQDPQKTSGKSNFKENGGFKLKEMQNTNGELKAVEEIYSNIVPELDKVLNLDEELLSEESPSEKGLLSEEGLPSEEELFSEDGLPSEEELFSEEGLHSDELESDKSEEDTSNKRKWTPPMGESLILKRVKPIKLSSVNVLNNIDIDNLNPNNPKTLVWMVKCKDITVRILLDLRAKKCFISKRMASKQNTVICKAECDTYATTANGWGIEIKEKTNFTLKTPSFDVDISAFIFPLKHVDIILEVNYEEISDRRVEHVIQTTSEIPVANPGYRHNQDQLRILKKQLNDVLDKGFIQPSSSRWEIPVIFVKKNDGSYRVFIEYKGLKKVSHLDKYPLPRMDDCF